VPEIKERGGMNEREKKEKKERKEKNERGDEVRLFDTNILLVCRRGGRLGVIDSASKRRFFDFC
jgi:hypothetical protein